MSNPTQKTGVVAGKTLWTTSGGSSAYAKIDTPPNLGELVTAVAKDAQALADARVKPYRTPVTNDTLRAPVE